MSFDFLYGDRLRITIKTGQPIEAKDVAEMLVGLNDEYIWYMVGHHRLKKKDVKGLAISEVSKGSQIYDLIPILIGGLQVANSIFDFTGHLKKGFDKYLGDGKKNPQSVDNTTSANSKNILKILKPVVSDNGTQINIGTLHLNINVTEVQAKTIQQGIIEQLTNSKIDALDLLGREQIKGFEESVSQIERPKELDQKDTVAKLITTIVIKNQVLFYWELNSEGEVTDKGYIESLHHKPHIVVFGNNQVEDEMTNSMSNRASLAYLVDVDVETLDNTPALYKITNIHKTLSKESLK